VCLVNRKEAENKEEIRAARSPRGFSNLDFKNEGSKSAQSHLINEIETDSIDLSRLDQTFLKGGDYLGYWSLSKYLKYKVKSSVDFLLGFEKNISEYCKKKGYDGVICGHIHHAEIKELNGILYMNDGDWVESCTALVEHHDGTWQIVHWTKEKD
jgi:UDP-2,3-diacylglucosamine pyrophosphatase LpxH